MDLQSAVLVQKNAIIQATRKLEAKKNEFPLDLKGIAQLKDELRILNQGMDDLNDINEELF